jgi:hypothetical protein
MDAVETLGCLVQYEPVLYVGMWQVVAVAKAVLVVAVNIGDSALLLLPC